MAESSILLGNVYVMLAYAFQSPRHIAQATSGAFEFDSTDDLFAHLVAQEANTQIKRGMQHDYFERIEEIPTVRGRINLASTLARRSPVRGRIVCEFEEYLPDTPHNQAVKAVVRMLLGRENVGKQRRRALTRLIPHFDGVANVPARDVRWRELRLHRTNASYRTLLAFCELAVKGLLLDDATGTTAHPQLREERMNDLFERFVREYFKVHYPELAPRKAHIPWDLSGNKPAQLPKMECDVMLSGADRTLIVDTKFYSESMQRYNDTAKVISGNLYQITAYTRNAAASLEHPVSGLLVYAVTDAAVQPDLDTTIGGQRVGATALALTRPWPQLRWQLDGLLERF